MSAELVIGALERLDDLPAELSVATDTAGAGVLVPVVQEGFAGKVARLWGREAPPWTEPPSFVRCDVRRGEWCSVTWYRDARAGDFDSPVRGAPAAFVAERWRRGGDGEVSHYVQVAGIPPEGLAQAARSVGAQAGLGEAGVREAERISGRLRAVGWTQFLAAVRGPGARLKFGVATGRPDDALAVVAATVDVEDTRRRFRRLRSRSAYAGFTVEPHGRLGVRLYARPVRSREVGFLLQAVA